MDKKRRLYKQYLKNMRQYWRLYCANALRDDNQDRLYCNKYELNANQKRLKLK